MLSGMKWDGAMNKHQERHQELHDSFTELWHDFVLNTHGRSGKTEIQDFVDWSEKQCTEPDHEDAKITIRRTE